MEASPCVAERLDKLSECEEVWDPFQMSLHQGRLSACVCVCAYPNTAELSKWEKGIVER